MRKQMMRITALALTILLSFSGTTVLAARPANYDANGCMPLITEPGDSAQPLIFCRGNDDVAIDEVTWVDAEKGKAVQLNGVDEYFRIGYNSLQLAEFTLAMWVKWEGASTAEGGSPLQNQRIFSARGTYRDRQYITLSPMETTTNGNDGLRLHMQYEKSDWDIAHPLGVALEQNAWHHIAVTANEQTLRLYLDGVLIAEELTMMSLAALRPQQLYLGKGISLGGDGYFNGLMDNVYLYKKVLDDDELRTLVESQRPNEPTTTEPTTTTSRPNTTEAVPGVQQQSDYSLPPIPPVVWIVTGVAAALIGALIVTENIRYKKEKNPPTE